MRLWKRYRPRHLENHPLTRRWTTIALVTALIKYVFPLESGTHPPQDAEQNSGDGFHSDHSYHAADDEGMGFQSDNDSQGAWRSWPEALAQQLDNLAAAVTAPSDAAKEVDGSFLIPCTYLYVPVRTSHQRMYGYVPVRTSTYRYVPVHTILPDPVHLDRIPA